MANLFTVALMLKHEVVNKNGHSLTVTDINQTIRNISITSDREHISGSSIG